MTRPVHPLVLAATFAAHAGLYLAFTADVGWRELVAAPLVAAVATAAAAGFAAVAGVQFRFRARDLAQAAWLPWYAVVGTVVVLRALARQLTGRPAAGVVRAVPFDFGPDGDPADTGRRALAILLTTATPNSIVLGLDQTGQRMFHHQVAAEELPVPARQLGARP